MYISIFVFKLSSPRLSTHSGIRRRIPAVVSVEPSEPNGSNTPISYRISVYSCTEE